MLLGDAKMADLQRWKCVAYCIHHYIEEEAGHFEKCDEGIWVIADSASAEIKRLREKCAHCPAPAVVDITLGDPINYSLCARCADLEERIHDGCSPDSADR